MIVCWFGTYLGRVGGVNSYDRAGITSCHSLVILSRGDMVRETMEMKVWLVIVRAGTI